MIKFLNRISDSVANAIAHRIPKKEFGEAKFARWLHENVSTPENRLILGATAILSQPFIDANNKKVDKETRKSSSLRTVAKILVGTTTGVLIRSGFIHLVNRYSAVGKIGEEVRINIARTGREKLKKVKIRFWQKFFTPSTLPETENGKTHDYKQYQNTVGSLLAVFTMIFTNFLIDKPLTNKVSDFLNRNYNKTVSDKKFPGDTI